ncbi:MAG: antibiotic biosynthesis monooxygenase [Proteobacteria bacterium]|nr:MAG: antibiotic biosynthesis monooxygenase [Pseudomonadota bacterium]
MPEANILGPETVTLHIQQHVKLSAVEQYEKWLPRIMAEAAKFPGHLGVHVIRPGAGAHEYSILIRFNSTSAAEAWLRSPQRKALLEEVADAYELRDHTEIHTGIDFWFTPAKASPRVAPGWKQWLLTTSVIWPLSTLVATAYRPLFQAVPLLGTWGVAQLLVAATVVALTVFLIMPRYVRAVAGWLYR